MAFTVSFQQLSRCIYGGVVDRTGRTFAKKERCGHVRSDGATFDPRAPRPGQLPSPEDHRGAQPS
jgi:hypothetical protein